jgi:hypothetical protein
VTGATHDAHKPGQRRQITSQHVFDQGLRGESTQEGRHAEHQDQAIHCRDFSQLVVVKNALAVHVKLGTHQWIAYHDLRDVARAD